MSATLGQKTANSDSKSMRETAVPEARNVGEAYSSVHIVSFSKCDVVQLLFGGWPPKQQVRVVQDGRQ